MIALALAALMAATPVQTSTPAAAQSTSEAESPVRLEDVEVTGRSLNSMIQNFVGSVAAPNANRGLARWRNAVCVGAVNLQPEAGRYLVDRVSATAQDIGLTPGAPGCTPNLVIMVTDDAPGLSRTLARQHRRALRMGGSGMDRGQSALDAFQTSDRPVRWWQVSMPVDAQTGERATRLPSECRGTCGADQPKGAPGEGGSSYLYAPNISVFAASRLSTQIVDDIIKTLVVVDVNQLEGVNADQLADYIAMVAFAQIKPDADTSGYASILNVFDAPDETAGLTQWDLAYLKGLYGTERTRKNLATGRLEVVASIERTHQRLRDASPEQP